MHELLQHTNNINQSINQSSREPWMQWDWFYCSSSQYNSPTRQLTSPRQCPCPMVKLFGFSTASSLSCGRHQCYMKLGIPAGIFDNLHDLSLYLTNTRITYHCPKNLSILLYENVFNYANITSTNHGIAIKQTHCSRLTDLATHA